MQKPYFSREYYQHSRDTLNTALDTVPAYRTWSAFDPGREACVDERYAALPLLTKKDMREHFPQGLVPDNRRVAEGLEIGEIEYVQTNGTTSEKVTNLWNQSWWNASEASSWKLNTHTAQLDHSCREAQLASALSVGFLSPSDLPMKSRLLNGRLLFLNEKATALEWTDFHYARMASELSEFKPQILEVNPAMLARLCWWAHDHHISLYSPQVIVITYELISKLQLQCIRRVMKSPVVSSYGTTETGYVFMQCEHGTLHHNTGFCRVDFMPLKELHGAPALGRLAVTPFHNPWMSLIRFDVGDLVRLDSAAACPCGRREGWRLSAVEGRVVDSTFSLTGRLVTTAQVDEALSPVSGLRDYELVQRTPERYCIKIIAEGHARDQIAACRKALHSVYGRDADIEIDVCAEIAPAASGKYRRTHAQFPLEPEDLWT
jgi:phenylacetate-CoA ligase